ncbi:hypothetical protein TIFTF001_019874 [Ficus carica]|uniref:Uncharacterized protein n=1 Tax=Ficus carica TaxID=3494 RepID=A0AA88A9P1_FICCA|nr:hypothetical protein TIFTF001_019874 [Ficus carica]
MCLHSLFPDSLEESDHRSSEEDLGFELLRVFDVGSMYSKNLGGSGHPHQSLSPRNLTCRRVELRTDGEKKPRHILDDSGLIG